MRLKNQHLKCASCNVSVLQPHPKCQRCDRQMDVTGDKFFDHVKIHKLRRSLKYDADEGLRYYVFNLSIGGFLVKGMTYNASTRSLMFPSGNQGGKKVRPVRAPGMTIITLREMLDQKIGQFEEVD